MKRLLVLIGFVLSCAVAWGQGKSVDLPTLSGWEGHRVVVQRAIAQGEHCELAGRYAKARAKRDTPLLRAGHATVLAWWQRLAERRIEKAMPPADDVYPLLESLRVDVEKTKDAYLLVALYKLDDATVQFPAEGDYEVKNDTYVENGQRKPVEVWVVKSSGTSKDRRLRDLMLQASKLAPEDPTVRVITSRYVEDPAARLRILISAYRDAPEKLGLLAVANIVDAAKSAGQKDTEASYRAQLRAMLQKEAETMQAKFLVRLRPDLAK